MMAAGMMLLGDRIPAEEALEWGLVWQVVEDAELDATALAKAVRLEAEPAATSCATKRSCWLPRTRVFTPGSPVSVSCRMPRA